MAFVKPIRVILALPAPMKMPNLVSILNAAGDMSAREISLPAKTLGKTAAMMKPDVIICYVQIQSLEINNAIKDMLDGCACKVLVLSPRSFTRDIRHDSRRIGTLIMNVSTDGVRSAQQYHDVLTRIRGMATEVKKMSEERGDTLIDRSFSLPESILSKYIIAIGSSTGGTEALLAVFKRLPPRMPGIVVVQHMPPVFTKMYADRLNKELPFKVTEGEHNVTVEPGTIHIAPGSNHMTIAKKGSVWQTQLGGTEKVGGHCPAVDVLFDSVAKNAGQNAVGIILTGMGADGAKGLLTMRTRGAFTIGQDEESAVVYGMPRKAFECGAVMRQAPLTEIPRVLLSHLSRAK